MHISGQGDLFQKIGPTYTILMKGLYLGQVLSWLAWHWKRSDHGEMGTQNTGLVVRSPGLKPRPWFGATGLGGLLSPSLFSLCI